MGRTKLLVIGNGFDLAHGLKTDYGSFIFELLYQEILEFKELLEKPIKLSRLNKDLLRFQLGGYSDAREQTLSAIDDLIDELNDDHSNGLNLYKRFKEVNSNYYSVTPATPFAVGLLSHLENLRWVDIEEQYYKIIKKQVTPPHSINLQEIQNANKELDKLSKKLEDYLDKQLKTLKVNGGFGKAIHQCLDRGEDYKRLVILNFNYTNLAEIHLRNNRDVDFINLHGQLNDENNPIIFGIGDEDHSLYPQILEKNVDDMLHNVKSLKYLFNSNYTKLKGLLNEDFFDVSIIGHSCGISDRTLLSEVYNHQKCKGIDIYHYNGLASFKESVYGICRYFDNNQTMRHIVKEFQPALSVPQARDFMIK